jgi:LytS/YehU family sensor histidine kinase
MSFEPDIGTYHGDVFYRLVLGILDYFYKNIIFYIGVIAIAQAVTYFRQLRQKEINEARLAETLANARLSSLKMKLQPHFIFNTLQSINVLMLDKQTESASEMISRLAHLLRHSIDMEDTQMVTVENELSIIQNYLAIEEIRFKDRLKLEKDIDPLVEKAVIPGLILQPLIENSVKHGIANKIGPGRICIKINRVDNSLKITVNNDGPGLPSNWNLDTHSGFGLQVTKKRLKLIYGNNYSFSVKNSEKGGVCAEIKIPFSEEILRVRKVSEK